MIPMKREKCEACDEAHDLACLDGYDGGWCDRHAPPDRKAFDKLLAACKAVASASRYDSTGADTDPVLSALRKIARAAIASAEGGAK